MRGARLLILTILVLSVSIQVQIATAHGDDQEGEGQGFELQANPVRLTTFQGGTVSSNITLSLEGEDPPVQAQLILNWDHRVPSDVSYSFNPTSIGVGQTSTLTFITHSDSSIGNFHFHVFAAMGNETESIRMALKIKHSHGVPPPPPPPPSQKDFTLNVSPTSWTINANETINYNVTLAPINGFNQAVSLSVTPSTLTGATVTFSQTTVTPPALLQLKIATNSSLKNDTYGFTVSATNGSLTHHVLVYVIVLPVFTPPPAAVILTLLLSRDNITLGDTVTASGNINPSQGHAGIPIHIKFMSADTNSWTTLTGLTTNGAAGYSYDWTPNQPGTYIVRAFWEVDPMHPRALSNVATLRVNPAGNVVQPTTEFPWFWLAIAAIIIIGVATAVTLKIRKKPVPTPTPTSA